MQRHAVRYAGRDLSTVAVGKLRRGETAHGASECRRRHKHPPLIFCDIIPHFTNIDI